MVRVAIDAGHGGRDPGAVGRDPFVLAEKEVTLAVAGHLEGWLEAAGWHPLMTRRSDRTLGLASRAAFANRLGADLFVSLHANAAASPAVEGIEVFHFPGSPRGASLAEDVLASLLVRFPGHRSRGVKEADFAVLRRTLMPAILVELEFLTSPRQLVFLADPATRQGLAAAVGEGLARAVMPRAPAIVVP